jgi:class 3 adenylate cyclase
MDGSPNNTPLPLILIIEDNPDTQRMLAKQMRHQGYEVVCHSNGQAGLDWARSNPADLIILDWMLPDMDGIQICHAIRKRFPPSKLPILMLSALGNEAEDRVKGLQAGANDFMAKPYYSEELYARIRLLLAAKQESERAEALAQRYTTPSLREQAASDPTSLERRRKAEAVILFADLRGFTKLSATTQTEKVLYMLDEFFQSMMRVVEHHGGAIFDVVGDQLMCAFNVPNPVPVPAYLAVKSALEMQRLFRELKAVWAQSGIEVGLGIGIHQGEVILGNVGGDSLKRYTLIGGPVNIASRLLALAQDGQVVISADVYANIRELPDIHVKLLPGVQLRGIDAPQDVYYLELDEPPKP